MNNLEITIKETTKDDLENVMSLWNDGDVMHFVGFPEGLGTTIERMESWINWVIAKPQRCHYSIYAKDIGYCGETFYNVDDNGAAALDIKLFAKARGKGIAKKALLFAIDQAFVEGKAKLVYVDPHPDNKNAWKLYDRLGFLSKPRPKYLDEGETYLEITRAQWDLQRRCELLDNKGFDQWSENYDNDVEKSENNNQYPFAGYNQVLNTVYNIISKHRGVVLDIGFGTGTLTQKLYNDGYNIYGIDFSEKMVEIAQEKMPKANLIKFNFLEGIPKELREIKFNAVISTYAIHHLTDEQKVDLILLILDQLLYDGIIVFGDVAFASVSDMIIAKEKDKDIWDDTEHYLIADQIANLLPDLKVNFMKASYCSGVLTIEK